MRIWFSANIPASSSGGVARSVRELSAGLSRLGHECRIVDAGDAPPQQVNYLAFAFRVLLLFVLCAKQRPDWIIGRSTDAALCAVVVRLFRMKTRIVLHSHGWEEKVFEAEQRLPRRVVAPTTTWKARAIRFPLLRLALTCCDACLCGTVEEARSLKERYPSHMRKIVCVPNGVAVREKQYWTWQALPTIKFCAIGNMTWKKNIGYAVDVFFNVRQTFPAAELTVIGSSMDELCRSAGRMTLEGVSAVQREDPDRMASRYAEAPFFLSTSLYEGGRSLAILEAMSFGCVVFASSVPSSLEFVKDRINGVILPSLSAEEDAAIIADVMRSPSLISALGRNAFCFSKRQSWSRQAMRLQKVLCNRR